MSKYIMKITVKLLALALVLSAFAFTGCVSNDYYGCDGGDYVDPVYEGCSQ